VESKIVLTEVVSGVIDPQNCGRRQLGKQTCSSKATTFQVGGISFRYLLYRMILIKSNIELYVSK
jgi:hypothetical protein